jgi:hypothetical protein
MGAGRRKPEEREETAMARTEATKRTEPVQVRDHLVDVLARDLVGAEPHEVLSVAPSRWYLTGFLVPREAPDDVRQDPDPEEGLGNDGDAEGEEAARKPKSLTAFTRAPRSALGTRGRCDRASTARNPHSSSRQSTHVRAASGEPRRDVAPSAREPSGYALTGMGSESNNVGDRARALTGGVVGSPRLSSRAAMASRSVTSAMNRRRPPQGQASTSRSYVRRKSVAQCASSKRLARSAGVESRRGRSQEPRSLDSRKERNR